ALSFLHTVPLSLHINLTVSVSISRHRLKLAPTAFPRKEQALPPVLPNPQFLPIRRQSHPLNRLPRLRFQLQLPAQLQGFLHPLLQFLPLQELPAPPRPALLPPLPQHRGWRNNYSPP